MVRARIAINSILFILKLLPIKEWLSGLKRRRKNHSVLWICAIKDCTLLQSSLHKHIIVSLFYVIFSCSICLLLLTFLYLIVYLAIVWHIYEVVGYILHTYVYFIMHIYIYFYTALHYTTLHCTTLHFTTQLYHTTVHKYITIFSATQVIFPLLLSAIPTLYISITEASLLPHSTGHMHRNNRFLLRFTYSNNFQLTYS